MQYCCDLTMRFSLKQSYIYMSTVNKACPNAEIATEFGRMIAVYNSKSIKETWRPDVLTYQKFLKILVCPDSVASLQKFA